MDVEVAIGVLQERVLKASATAYHNCSHASRGLQLMPFPHLASRLYGTPLLLARAKLDILLAVLGERIGWPEPHAAVALPTPRALPDAPAGLAVIPVYGTLVRRALGLEAASGLTSYSEIGALLDGALADPRVTGILLDVDSPGGEAGGVFELAQRIRAADRVKPVWAIAADSAFSAAYVLASAASRVYVTQTGGVGSIGVIALHVDQSARDAQQGYRYTAITAGEQKNDFSPHEPLDPAAHARLQAEVDRLYGIFIDHVAMMRDLEPASCARPRPGCTSVPKRWPPVWPMPRAASTTPSPTWVCFWPLVVPQGSLSRQADRSLPLPFSPRRFQP
jgi:signal peptide peptidase SppA